MPLEQTGLEVSVPSDCCSGVAFDLKFSPYKHAVIVLSEVACTYRLDMYVDDPDSRAGFDKRVSGCFTFLVWIVCLFVCGMLSSSPPITQLFATVACFGSFSEQLAFSSSGEGL